MYRVLHQANVSRAFYLFVDAWLYAYLECESFSYVVGDDGTWLVNPGEAN